MDAPVPAIPFNRPTVLGSEPDLIREVLAGDRWSGNGPLTRRCQDFFRDRYGLPRALLTGSCTDALEMAALLTGVGPGDEVILPSFTFVSTANAFALRGATLRFADSLPDHPNLDPAQVESLLGDRTRVIVPVHYGGVACDMDTLLALAARHGLRVVEDAAQCIEARHRGRQLGTLGQLGTFSFHETKNLHCGEGGLLLVNDPALAPRAEVIHEKGTNRAAFFRGEVDKYGWVDLGSSFLPSELQAAVLWAQLEHLEAVAGHRLALWERYREGLQDLESGGHAQLPRIPAHAEHNGHIFYLVLPDLAARTALIEHLKKRGVYAVFHYQSLHGSAYFRDRHDGRRLPQADRYSDCLLRLPLFHALSPTEQARVVDAVRAFFGR